jgi:hypothetical protein
VVLLDVLEEFRDVLKFVFVQNEVEDFRSHVLRSGHGELAQVGKLEGTAVVDEFDFFEDGVGEASAGSLGVDGFALVFLGLDFNQDILSFEIAVYNVIFGQEL